MARYSKNLVLESFVVRPALVALVLFAFLQQHFICCCVSVCAAACSENVTASNFEKQSSECHHRHGAGCPEDSDSDDSDPSPQPSGSPHRHHFCIGSHVFYLSPDNIALDFAPQIGGANSLPDNLSLIVQKSAAALALPGTEPPYPMAPRELRAYLCVYCV